ncbi:hypothetical protein AB0A73_21755 [Glycomyces sp. NPDC047369]
MTAPGGTLRHARPLVPDALRLLAAAALTATVLTGCTTGPQPEEVTVRVTDVGTPLAVDDPCGLLGADETTALAEAYGYDPGAPESSTPGRCFQTVTRFQGEIMKESTVVITSADVWDSPEGAAAAYQEWTDPDAIAYRLAQPFPDQVEEVEIEGEWSAAVLSVGTEPADGAQFKALARAGKVIVSVRITVALPGTGPCPAPGAVDCAIGAGTVQDWITATLLPAVHQRLDDAGLLTR